MEVHANAPLSPIGRRRVVDRVVVEGWSVTAAAEAAGVSERTVYRWLARFRVRGSGLVDRRRCRSDPAQDAGRPGRGDLRAAPVAADRGADPERLQMPLVDVSAVLRGRGWASAAGWRRPSRSTATSAPRPASSSTSTSRSSAGSSAARASASPAAAPAAGRPTPPAAAACRLGIRPRRASTTTAASPTSRSCPTRRPDPDRLPASRGRLVRRATASPSSG